MEGVAGRIGWRRWRRRRRRRLWLPASLRCSSSLLCVHLALLAGCTRLCLLCLPEPLHESCVLVPHVHPASPKPLAPKPPQPLQQPQLGLQLPHLQRVALSGLAVPLRPLLGLAGRLPAQFREPLPRAPLVDLAVGGVARGRRKCAASDKIEAP